MCCANLRTASLRLRSSASLLASTSSELPLATVATKSTSAAEMGLLDGSAAVD